MSRHPLDKVCSEAERRFLEFEARCYEFSKTLVKTDLSSIEFDPAWICEQEPREYFRCVSNSLDALSPSGSLADGARMNIGGAQDSTHTRRVLGDFTAKRGAIYISESWQTALSEKFGSLAPNEKLLSLLRCNSEAGIFRISPLRALRLIEFESVAKSVSFLAPYLQVTRDMNGLWGDLKKPAPVQVLAHWLIEKAAKAGNADGIRFHSTVDPIGWNTCFYARTESKAREILRAELFDPP